jgi:hypothetical protein
MTFHSSHLAFGFRRLSDVSVNWSNFLVAYWGEWRKIPFDDQRHHSFKWEKWEKLE